MCTNSCAMALTLYLKSRRLWWNTPETNYTNVVVKHWSVGFQNLSTVSNLTKNGVLFLMEALSRGTGAAGIGVSGPVGWCWAVTCSLHHLPGFLESDLFRVNLHNEICHIQTHALSSIESVFDSQRIVSMMADSRRFSNRNHSRECQMQIPKNIRVVGFKGLRL